MAEQLPGLNTVDRILVGLKKFNFPKTGNLSFVGFETALALGRNLQVTEDEDGKVKVSGMPLPSQDLEMSVTIAKDLRLISRDYE